MKKTIIGSVAAIGVSCCILFIGKTEVDKEIKLLQERNDTLEANIVSLESEYAALQENFNTFVEESVVTTGSLSGNITYFFNDFKGNVADTGSYIVLIPTDGSAKEAKTVSSYVDWTLEGRIGEQMNEYNVFVGKVDGTGSYIIQNIPQGTYKIYAWSNHTNTETAFDDKDKYKERISEILSDVLNKGNSKSLAEITAYSKYTTKTVEIIGGETTVFSHDFGTTYF